MRGYGNYRGRGNYGGGGGGGYRGTYRGSSNRGSFESRGGRGGSYSSFSNDNRYNSSDRYTSNRDRIDEGYKKYRSESTSNYSSRDYGRGVSPERKRMRMDGASGGRSHESGSHYGGSYGNRQDSYVSDRRSFVEERRRSPGGGGGGGYRKSGGMPPPRSPARATAPRSRVSRPPRRSYRGRTLRSRGSYRGSVRSRGSYTSRRFVERPLSYTRAYRSVKGRSSIKSKGESASSTEEDWDADDKEDIHDEKKEIVKKSPKNEVPDIEDEEEDEGGAVGEEGEETDKEGGDDAEGGDADEQRDRPVQRSRLSGKPFIQLSCVHCKEKCITFAGYAQHLISGKHRAAMSGVARRHKAQLMRMRLAQRGAQRELEAAHGTELAARTTFCLICRLNHRTTRHDHNLTDTHRAMRRFLMPYCRICRQTFRSPMIYEHHICSLEHIKRKANQARRPSPKVEGSGDEGMDVDLDNFMTLDSVGDVDEVDDEDSAGEKKDEETVVKKAPKVEINIGSEHIKKMEVWWCELCRVYLPRAEAGSSEEGETLRRHCRLRVHLGRYVQHRDTRTLRRHAERIHRQLHQQKDSDKEASGEDIKVKPEPKTSSVQDNAKKPAENGTEDNHTTGGSDEKLWAEMDKDIGELLREVDPHASDDEDDLDRYDKFRKSDKKSSKTVNDVEDNDECVAEKSNEKEAVDTKGA